MRKTFPIVKNTFILFVLISLSIKLNTQAQFFSISGGHQYSASVCQDGRVLQWGNIFQTTNATSTPVNIPTALQLPSGVTFSQADAGSGSHALALDCNGKVWAWGSNSDNDNGSGAIDGQLGSATLQSSAIPIPVSGVGGTGQLSAIYVSGSNRSSYAITPDNNLVSWGLNSSFELGRPTTGNTFDNVPNYVLTAANTQLKNVIQVDAGDNTVYALDANGFVYSWGGNTDLSLGRGGVNGTASQYASNVLKSDGTPLKNIILITGGDKHGLALADNGTLWSWGGNWGPGQLGYSTTGSTSGYAYQVVGVGGTGILQNVVGISAGQASSIAVLGDGSVVTWGSNCFYGPAGALNAGEQGQGTTACNSGSTTAYVPHYVLDCNNNKLTNINSISDADAVYYAISSSGDVYTWGYNIDGELGVGNNVNAGCATKLNLNLYNCGLPDPCPDPNLGPDIPICNLSDLTNVTLSTQNFRTYIYKWYYRVNKNGSFSEVTVSDTNIFKPTKLGQYLVEVSVNNGGCTECKAGRDTITIDQPNVNAGTFCKQNSLTFSVPTPANGIYRWWKTQTGTTDSLATRGNPQTVALSQLNPTIVGQDTVYNLYYEDLKTYSGVLGPLSAAALTGAYPRDITDIERNRIYFDALTTVNIAAVWIKVYNYYSAGNSSVTLTIYNSSNAVVNSITNSLNIPITNGSPTDAVRFPMNVTVPPGTGYYIKLSGTDNGNLKMAFFDGSSNVSYPYFGTGDLAGLMTLNGVGNRTDGGGVANSTIGIINWEISGKKTSSCGRTRVSFTKDCPCNAPNPLTATTTTGASAFCTGTLSTLTLQANPTPATPTIDPFNYLYQWYKNGTPIADPDGKQSTLLINSTTGVATYTLRVGHTSLLRSKCYTEAPLTISKQDPISDNTIISGNDTVCSGSIPKTITGNPAKGGNGAPTYQWISSNAVNGTYSAASGNANNISYSPLALTSTTYFKRVVTSGGVCKNDTSSSIYVFVDPTVTAGILTSNSGTTVCSGTSVSFTISAVTGGTPSAYKYQWQSSSNGITWTNIPNATSANYNPGIITTSTYYRQLVTSIKCSATSNQILISVDTPVASGSNTLTSGTQFICQTSIPVNIVGSTPTGGKTPISYAWTSVPNNSDALSAAGKDLTFTQTLSATTIFKRIVTSTGACKNDTSNAVTITIDPTITDAGVVSSTSTPANVCTGFAPSISVTAASPASSSYTYQWQTSTDNVSWTNISSATSATLNPSPTISSSTYFRRVVSSAKCSASSIGFFVPVDVPVTSNTNTIGSDQNICEGSVPNTLTGSTPIGGQTPNNYNWVSSSTGTAPWATAGTGQNLSFTTGLVTTTFYKRIVTSTGACKNDTTSGTIKINVDPKIKDAGTITPINNTICSGNSPIINGTVAIGGTAPLSYQWQYLDGTTWTNISTSTTQPGPLNFAPSIAKATQYRRVVQSLVCSLESNVANIDTVNGMRPGSIVPTQTELCAGDVPGIIEGDATPATGGTGGSNSITYQWQQSTDGSIWFNTSGNSTSYTPGALIQDTYFRRRSTNGTGACDTAYTTLIKIAQYKKLNPGTIQSNDTSVCVGSSIMVKASIPTLGSPTKTYTWTIANAPSFIYRDTLAGSSSPNLILNNLSSTTRVRRVVTDKCGTDTSSQTFEVQVLPLDIPNIAILTDLNQTFCNNSDVTLTAITNKAGKARNVSWTYNGKTVSTVPDSIYVIAASDLVVGGKIKALVKTDQSLFCTAPLAESAELVLNVNTIIKNNTVDQTLQNVCVGTQPQSIKGSAALGTLLNPGYLWQISNNEKNWTTIANSTLQDYQPKAFQGTYFYRRIAISAGTCANDTSSTHAKIISDSTINSGILTATTDTICKNTVPRITATLPSGGVTPYGYQWESSIDNVGFFPISGETNADITLSAISATTYYRRVVTTLTSSCPYNSDTAKVTVTQPIESGSNNLTSGNQSSCGTTTFGKVIGSVAIGGLSPTKYQWQRSADGSTGWNNIGNETNKDYSPGLVNSTTYLRRIVTSTGKCSNDISNSIRLFVDTPVLPGGITALATQCGTDTVTISNRTSTSGGLNGFTYSWSYKSDISTGWATLASNKDSLKIAFKDLDITGRITQFYFIRNVASLGGNCFALTDSIGVTICQKPIIPDTIRSGLACANVPITGKLISAQDFTPNKNGILKVDGSPAVPTKNGALSINVSDSTFTYTPNPGFIGRDTAVFTICDITTNPPQCSKKPLYITIYPVNNAPIVLSEIFSTYRNQSITGMSITTNDKDPNNDTLYVYPADDELFARGKLIQPYKKYIDSILAKPQHGRIVMSNKGDFTYEPDKDFTGKDQAVFWVCDYSSTTYCNGFYCKKDTVTFDVKPYRIFVPEGFSPNGDGVNDFFVIRSEVTLKMELKVYNRWGNLVYENKDYKNDWNGNANRGLVIGEGLPDGTYYIYVNVNDEIPDKDRFQYITISR